ncbi:MAG: patatin-like phospholipase family protein [Bacteriovoracia bacterium]
MKKQLCLTILIVALFSSCSGTTPKPTPLPPSPEVVLPPPPPDLQPPVVEEKMEEKDNEAKQREAQLLADDYVVVLGPGMARTFSYIGVLRELESRKAKIKAIVGVEMGAVVAAIWASSNANTLEWELHKFKKDFLFDYPLFKFGSDQVAEGNKLLRYLGTAIKVKNIENTKVPLLIASATDFETGGQLIIDRTGSVKDVVRGAMGIPGVIKSYGWNGQERMTSAMEQPFPIESAKSLGLGKILCVDTISRGATVRMSEATEERVAVLMKTASVLAKSQLQQCDVVLSIPLERIGYLDFSSRADLIFKGRKVVQRWLEAR